MVTAEDIDLKQIGLEVFIDHKKAFDTINYELLIEKLNGIGIMDSALKISKSFF